ncbi:hypothetical protein, partial [Cellulomonas sp. B6]|uniref:hypothetical protein n=1 Tax=Cellulomonas sp. B6 TaxID=1295626 RepID=UPI00073CF5E5
MTDVTDHAAAATPADAARRGRRPGRRWEPVTWGLHRAPGLEPLLAWSLVLPPSAVVSHLTAAGLHGWWTPALSRQLPLLVDQPATVHRTRRPGVRVTRTHGPVPAAEVRGVRVAAPAHTLLACARDLALLDLVVLVDSALRSGCTADEVRAVCVPRRRGVVALRAALALADPRAESPWESVLRLMHVAFDAPVVPQHVVHDDTGRFVARADLWIEGTTTIHEYDGAVHRAPDQHRADLRRDRALVGAGWTRRGFTSADLCDRPAEVLHDLDTTLGRPHVPERLRRWATLLDESTFTARGRARL